MTMPVARDVFITFLLNAKRQTYAVQGDVATVTPLLRGSRQLEYRDRALFYRDIYFGDAFFVGQETVYYDEAPAWAMCYAGGSLAPGVPSVEVGQASEFLRTALRQVTPERPYRGPSTLRHGAFLYTDESHGDVERFWGVETITHKGHLIHQLRYHGGVLR